MLNLVLQDVLPNLISRMNRRINDDENQLNIFLRRYENDVQFLNKFQAQSGVRSLDWLAEVDLDSEGSGFIFLRTRWSLFS